MNIRYLGETGGVTWVYASDEEYEARNEVKPKQELTKEAVTEYLKWLCVQEARCMSLLEDELCKNQHEYALCLKRAGFESMET